MLADGCRGMEAGRAVLTRNARAIDQLEAVALLALHGVRVALAARYFVLAERLDV